ncbi:MAG: alpha/beta hydrolase [Myxococcales bacterium]|nr:alpha/beta hydrolase [Myxococcales bacterium]
MGPRFLVFALFLCTLSGCAAGFRAEARGRVVLADDGYPLRVYEMVERGSARAPARDGLVFYIDGSRRTSVLERMGALAGFAMLGFPVILVEPRGLADDGSFDAVLAWRSDTKPRRVADQRAVIEHALAGRAPRTVLLVGASEGGDIAARLAAEEPRVTHVLLMGSGGGLDQANELGILVDRQPGYLGIRDRAELERAFARIRHEPDSLAQWLGHPYRRWSSYLWSRPLDDLKRSRASVLALHGSEDENVPPESARALGAALGPGSLVEYRGADHRFRQRSTGRSTLPCAEIDVVSWLRRTSVISAEDARTFSDRTRRAHPEWFPGGRERCAL